MMALPWFNSAAHAQDTERTVTGTAPIAADGTVSLENHDGAITVSTWDRDEVEYEARIVHRDEEVVQKTEIRLESSSDEVSIRSETDDGGFWENRSKPDIFYTVRVPAGASIEIDDHASEIRVEALQGDVDIDTHDGSIELRDIGGDVDIDSHDGRIQLAGIGGDLEIDTHDSPIDARGLNGALELDTHDGSVSFAFDTLTRDIELDHHDADITLIVPADAGFDLRTDTHDAEISVEPEMSVSSMSDGNVRATVNGGGPEVYMSAHDGSLTINTQ
jgi:DUF4097 and DUF4098 domain-containing protein YvlB